MAKKTVVFNAYDENQSLLLAKKQKAKRRARATKRLTALILLVLTVFYFGSDYSKIMTIAIANNEFISQETIVELTQVKTKGSFMLFTKSAKVETDLMASGYFDSVSVSKGWDRSLKVAVTPTPLIAYCANEQGFLAVNESGKVCQISGDFSGLVATLPVLHDFTDEIMAQFAAEYAKIPSQVRLQVSDVYFKPAAGDDLRCQFNMDDGKILYLRIDKMASQLANNNYIILVYNYGDYKYFDFLGEYVYRSK